MSAGKHTPGPWGLLSAREVRVKARTHHIPLMGSRNENIGLLSSWRQNWPEEAQANARLIAAAPDLLQALDDLLRDAKDPMDKATTEHFRKQASAAIAKATGTAE